MSCEGTMKEKIKDAVCRYGMDVIFSGAVIGFSGGADSSALLHYLKDKCECLLAVHINHMIRGAEADRDEEFCKSVCEKYGVAFSSYRVDIPKIAKENGKGLEQTAREERYRIFKEILRNNPQYKCIVTAHNANDNSETVIFNLARGCGANGLCGIKPVNGSVYRPLIYSTRDDIIKYCSDNNIEYVTDSTNSDTDYTRNRIRHCILPELLKINPNFLDATLRLGEILQADEEYILDNAKGALGAATNGKIPKKVAACLDSAVLSRVLKEVAGVNLDYSAIKACCTLIKGWKTGKMVNLGDGLTFKLEYDYCQFIKTEETKKREFFVYLNEGVNEISDTGMVICVNDELSREGYSLSGSVSLNPDYVVGRLYVRSKQEGDTVKSGGMIKKLKRIFTDRHIPSQNRQSLPVICDDMGVLAVPGIVARDGAFDKHGKLVIKAYNKIDNTTNGGNKVLNEEKE